MNNTIDFILVNYKSFELANILINSIHKYTKPHDYHIYLVDNSDQEELFTDYSSDKFTYLKGNNDVEQRGFPSVMSSAHSHSLQKGYLEGKGDYVCFLDIDTCFLDYWTEYVIPILDDKFFVSHRWEPSRKIARPQFLITKRAACEAYKVDLSEAYQDSGGIFTKRSIEHNLPFLILNNSYNNKELQEIHAVDPGRVIMNSGEQAFIKKDNNLIPFFWHFGRGTVKGIDKNWFKLLEKYLEL